MEIQATQLKERLSEVYELALDGLFTQGDHHKQWFLEQIVKAVVGPENYHKVIEEFEEETEGEGWEPGIAP